MTKTKLLLTIPALALFLAACNTTSTEVDESTSEPVTDSNLQEVMEKDAMEADASDSAMVDDEGDVYTLDEVAAHSADDDCWIAIEGQVYDVSEYVNPENKHPGGAAILQGCGKDATEFYNNRPNGSGAHSDKARSFLPNFLIGDLATE